MRIISRKVVFLNENCSMGEILMTPVSIGELQHDLLTYLHRVEAGETLIIVQEGKQIAEMKPVNSGSKTLRPYGLCSGEFKVPDDFDEPLPEDIVKGFEGK